MTARVLVVDDIAVNVKLLEARLAAEYFVVLTASSGPEALEICASQPVDIVLLDVMMPEMDGFEVCRALKENPATQHIPVVMVTALDQPSDRVKGLEAGADDFLTKPPDDMQLLARVRSLVRLKSLTDELRERTRTGQQIAEEDAERAISEISIENGNILLVDDDPHNARRISNYLSPDHKVDVLADPVSVAMKVADAAYEVVLVSMNLKEFDALRVCSQLRTLEQTRNLPIILIAEESDRAQVIRGLDLGVNDFILCPVEKHELAARVRTQLRRHRYALELRESVNHTLAMAVIDDLTGLYNRRYFDRHLSLMLDKAQTQGRELAVMMLDIDFFKPVNDNFGHGVGDLVLREFAARLQRSIRGIDLACRYGGEEFVVLMPDTNQQRAGNIGERIRSAIGDVPFVMENGLEVSITVSIGVAMNELAGDTPQSVLRRADQALYRAKETGRDRVVFDAA